MPSHGSNSMFFVIHNKALVMVGVILFNFLLDTIANNTSLVLRFCNVKEVKESLSLKKRHVVFILAQRNQNF
jgi:hypothetical protein